MYSCLLIEGNVIFNKKEINSQENTISWSKNKDYSFLRILGQFNDQVNWEKKIKIEYLDRLNGNSAT